MSNIKFKDCIYCKGRGYTDSTLMKKTECKECGGTGTKEVKEKRKPIQLEVPLHKRFSDLAHDYKTSVIGFCRMVVDDYENQKMTVIDDENTK